MMQKCRLKAATDKEKVRKLSTKQKRKIILTIRQYNPKAIPCREGQTISKQRRTVASNFVQTKKSLLLRVYRFSTP